MMPTFRIIVGDKYYAGETDGTNDGWHTDPWSGNSFQTGRIQRAALRFSDDPKEARFIYDRTTLIGETRRIIEYMLYTDIGWHDMRIEQEPFAITLKFNLEYLLEQEDEANRLRTIYAEMKKDNSTCKENLQVALARAEKAEKDNRDLYRLIEDWAGVETYEPVKLAMYEALQLHDELVEGGE